MHTEPAPEIGLCLLCLHVARAARALTESLVQGSRVCIYSGQWHIPAAADKQTGPAISKHFIQMLHINLYEVYVDDVNPSLCLACRAAHAKATREDAQMEFNPFQIVKQA